MGKTYRRTPHDWDKSHRDKSHKKDKRDKKKTNKKKDEDNDLP